MTIEIIKTCSSDRANLTFQYIRDGEVVSLVVTPYGSGKEDPVGQLFGSFKSLDEAEEKSRQIRIEAERTRAHSIVAKFGAAEVRTNPFYKWVAEYVA